MPETTPQAVNAPLSNAVIFLVLTVNPGAEATVRALCSDLSALVRSIGTRAPDGNLSCVVGVGADVWDRLVNAPKPRELHPFRELRGVHHAPSTPGDLLLHLRADRMDLCYELATQITGRLADAAVVVDEVHGFRYFDDRSIIGFVDGSENPRGEARPAVTLITDEDPAYVGGSYVIVQKYIHDLDKWNSIAVEQQERIIGRKKLSNIELDDAEKPSYAHNALTSIEEDGEELEILRDNMPFGRPGQGEHGTYFIGYCRSPRITERMLENMFVGDPPGNYDRLLDVSRAVTGGLFFVPTASWLDDLAATVVETPKTGDAPLRGIDAETNSKPSTHDGSLRIGSLKDAG